MLNYYCIDPQLTWLMVNWLALGASNYIYGVYRAVKCVGSSRCSVNDRSSERKQLEKKSTINDERTSHLAPRTSHIKLLYYSRSTFVATLRTLYVVTVRCTMLLHDWNCAQFTAVILYVPEMTENCEFEKNSFSSNIVTSLSVLQYK